jgi:cell wall assembly regulator SMI1
MKERLQLFLEHMAALGGESRDLIFDQPATEAQLFEIEDQLGYKIPADFKSVLLNLSSHCDFRWFLPDDLTLPKELRGIFAGELYWDVSTIVELNQEKDSWIKEVFPNVQDDYDKVWHNKFVFHNVANGDFLSIDLAPASYGQIIYLSHDDGNGHGYVMAHSFTELLNSWIQVGCTGPEDWQWLPFVSGKTSGIDPACANAALWRQTIKWNKS